MLEYSFCCITIRARGKPHGRQAYNVDDGDRSYLNKPEFDFVVNANKIQTCFDHYNQCLKSNHCVSPLCDNTTSTSFKRCPSRFLIYCNLYEEAKVYAHQKCISRLREVYDCLAMYDGESEDYKIVEAASNR